MKNNFTFIKMRFAFFAVSFFLCTHFLNAQTYNWVGGVSTDFYDVNNWDNNTINFANLAYANLTIGVGNPNNPINVGHSGNDVVAKRPGIFTTKADANIIVTGTLYPNNETNLNGTVTLNGSANLNSRKFTYLGKAATGILNMNSGTFNSNFNLYIGNGTAGNGTANVSGGTLYANANLEVGNGSGNPTGNLNITGGTVDVKTAINIGTNGHVFISGIGQLIVTGDKKTVLENYIASGKISCPGGQSLTVVYNGTRTSVTIYQDPNRLIQEFSDYIILKNGKIEAKIWKGSSNIQSLKINGVETLLQTNTGNPTRVGTYYDFVTSQGFETIWGTTFSIKEETADYIDVSFSRPYISGVNATPVDVEIHYVLKKDDVGLYNYSILRHKAAYPSFDLGSWRQVMWINNTVTDKICVTDLKTWNMPQPGDSSEATGIAEIIKITSGTRAGKYDGKYEFSENLIDLKAYGHSSDKNNIGIWAVMGSHEYFNGGPTHHDLNSASGIIHICMNGVHYNDAGFVVPQGEEWSKIYGPYLMYANQKATAVANWDEAKARAAKDEAEWPFAWLTNTPEYPLAAGRGNVVGKFSISDSLKPEVNGGDAWIGVTQLSSDSGGNWQFEGKNYQYWVKTDASGNFNIKNVRPGTYTLFAYKNGATGEYRQETVVVTAGADTNIGDINWAIPRDKGKIVFEVGVPNRTTDELKFGDFDYCEGYVQEKFPAAFPNQKIEYNVDDRNWKTALPYVQSAYFKPDMSISGTYVWNMNFKLTGTIPTTGNARLTVAYASSDYAQNLIEVNGSKITPVPYYPPNQGGNAFLRQSNHAKYGLATFNVPYSKLKVGNNVIAFKILTSQVSTVTHIMYDYISLEGELTSTFNIIDTDKDGVEDAKDLCSNTPTGETVNASGCSASQLDDDNDGYSKINDCNDNDATVHEPILYYVDADKDGFGSPETAMLCSSVAPEGYASNSTDCNDDDATVHEPILYYVDADKDGFGSTETVMLCSSVAPEGYATNNTDCDDSKLLYADNDGDGLGAGPAVACGVENNDDCDDTNAIQLTASIPDVYAVNNQQKNTIYVGYGTGFLNIKAIPAGGTGSYSYVWSTNQTNQTIAVSQAGSYTVIITDSKGCQTSASIDVNATNVQCGNSGNKVMVCHNGQETCVSSSAIQAHLNHGDKLGSCNNTPANSTTENVTVFPNPVVTVLTVKVDKVYDGAELSLYDILSRKVKSEPLTNTMQLMSMSDLYRGIYFLHVKNGEHYTIKAIVKK